ncbi:MAG: DUF3164 family protein [Pseudomonadota bacterium]
MPNDMTNGDAFWTDPKGRLVPVSQVKETDRLIDEEVRKILRFGEQLMGQIARFRNHCFDDLGALQDLLNEKYGASRGGRKGNVSFTSFDGLIKVEVRIADQVHFGPELQTAKALIDEYIEEVSEGVPDAVRALLEHAFEVGREGVVNRGALYSLRRLEVNHHLWKSAMEAIADSMRVMGTKERFQISVRDDPQQPFRALPLTLTGAYEPQEGGAA